MTMTLTRIALKRRLLDERRVMRRSGNRMEFVNACALCGRTDMGLDLDETILSRNDAHGDPELLRRITETDLNLSLICNPCNIGPRKTKWGRAHLTDQLVHGYGSRAIANWITMLNLKAPDDFLHYVAARAKEVEK